MEMKSAAGRIFQLLAVTLVLFTASSVTLRAQVTLTATTSPATAQPGVTTVNLTGSNFPTGTILPGQVTVSLQPQTAGPAMTATTKTVTTIIGSTRRISFTFTGPSVANPTAYLVSISGTTSQNASFSSSNTSTLMVSPPASFTLGTNSGQQGKPYSITINGQGTYFTQGSTVATFGPGISVGGGPVGGAGPISVTNATFATASITIDPAAVPQSQDVTVQTGVQVTTLAAGFTVTPGTPVITQVNPNTGLQGQTPFPVTITGNFTHFSGSSVVTFSGTGVTAGAPTAATATSVTVTVTVAGNAPLGAQGVQVVTGGETVSLASAFTVTNGTPVLTLVNPNTGQQGQQSESVNLTGQFTHWVQGTSTASFGAGITVATLTVNSATTRHGGAEHRPGSGQRRAQRDGDDGRGSGHADQRLHRDQRNAGADAGESKHRPAGTAE